MANILTLLKIIGIIILLIASVYAMWIIALTSAVFVLYHIVAFFNDPDLQT